MMPITATVILLANIFMMGASTMCGARENPQEPAMFAGSIDFNSGWKWRRGGEKEWRAVDLPHDFMFEAPWDEKAVHSQRVFKPLGEAFYRKTFAYDPAWEGRRVILDFGGIMFFGDVRINGKKVAETEYGYLGFETDVTDRLKKDGPNVVEVWAKVEGGPNGSRWYTGGGLYRGVKMKIAGTKRIARHGVSVKTKGETVFVEVELDGFRGERGDYEIVAESEGVRTSAPVTKGDNRRRFAVALPPFEMKGAARWSPESRKTVMYLTGVNFGEISESPVL